MLALTPVDLNSVAVIGASCGDIAVGVGATLMEIACDKPDLVVHALVLTGGGTEREIEEKNAFITLCPSADMVLGPRSSDRDEDHRFLAELIPTEFRDHLVLGYEVLQSDSDLLHAALYLPIPTETAHEKARLLTQCYPSQSRRLWFDDEAFVGLMRVRGVQCKARYAEAFAVEKAVSDFGSDFSVN
jgi:hypothetical protein